MCGVNGHDSHHTVLQKQFCGGFQLVAHLKEPIGLARQLEHVGGGVEPLRDGLPRLRRPGETGGAPVLDLLEEAGRYDVFVECYKQFNLLAGFIQKTSQLKFDDSGSGFRQQSTKKYFNRYSNFKSNCFMIPQKCH